MDKKQYLAAIETDLHSRGMPTLADRIQKTGPEAQMQAAKKALPASPQPAAKRRHFSKPRRKKKTPASE